MNDVSNKDRKIISQKKIAIKLIIAITLSIGSIYIGLLLFLLNYKNMSVTNIILFIKLCDVLLAGLAFASCILCYSSTKKEELFTMSLVYIVFFIDIVFGNLDKMSINNGVISIDNYILVSTSLLRVGILLISILPFKKIRRLITENKIKSIIIVTLTPMFITLLERYNIIPFLNFEDASNFINYNIFITFLYIIVSVIFLVKSVKQKEYIYSVISSSTFLLAIKWIYATVSVVNNSSNIKLASISITYMGFIIFILGIVCELILSIKKNKILENELNIFKKLVDESKYSCIVIYDEQSNIKYANDAIKNGWSKDTNYTDSEVGVIIKSMYKGICQYKLAEIKQNLLQFGYWSGNVDIKQSELIIDLSVQNIYSTEGKKNTVIIFRDISSKIRTEKCILEFEKMKSYDKVKNEFFANISHELRTPLNIFYSTIQLLDVKSKGENENFKIVYVNHRQCLKTNCQRMLRLINNIVDITKIDVGFTKAKFTNCDIVKLVEDITLSVINYAIPKEINIVFDTEIEEHVIKCDLEMIERAMLNLLSNAIKFTNINGNISVEIFIDEEWVHIVVKDDGIGIPIEIQGSIFDRFVQSDKSLTRLNEGSGIGLSIVKSIVELNNGNIYLYSDGKNGTEFEIVIPNIKLEGTEKKDKIYEVDIQKIELELSDIYELN